LTVKQLTWQEKVKELEAYQKEHELSLRDLAEESGRSIAQLSYALMLAKALRKRPELYAFKNMTDALNYLKKLKIQ